MDYPFHCLMLRVHPGASKSYVLLASFKRTVSWRKTD
uniref:Uncharacterized protein n=1 Tax=Brassica campestris TaxID=3711 RepID=A0A3P6D5S8_BRACM|nr:unnamed protein product [Brassica rapa]